MHLNSKKTRGGYLDTQKTLDYLLEEKNIKRSKAWLERGRWAKTGPRFEKIAGRPMTKPEWIDKYLADCENGNHNGGGK